MKIFEVRIYTPSFNQASIGVGFVSTNTVVKVHESEIVGVPKSQINYALYFPTRDINPPYIVGGWMNAKAIVKVDDGK